MRPMRVDLDKLEGKTYIGDGVYAGFDGFQIWLWTQQGDSIAIEAIVMNNLVNYARSIWPPADAGAGEQKST